MKLAITYGDFDCLNHNHFHLVKEMRKIVLPDNNIGIVLPDDYPVFVNKGRFPIQDLQHRLNNSAYLCKVIHQSMSADPSPIFKKIIEEAISRGDKVIYVGYDDEKDFPGRNIFANYHIPLRFIKHYAGK